MTSDRINEIQGQTAYADSASVKQALLQVWNECEQEHLKTCKPPLNRPKCRSRHECYKPATDKTTTPPKKL